MNDRIRKKTKVAVAIADRKNPLPKCEKLALPTLRANPKYPVYRPHKRCVVCVENHHYTKHVLEVKCLYEDSIIS